MKHEISNMRYMEVCDGLWCWNSRNIIFIERHNEKKRKIIDGRKYLRYKKPEENINAINNFYILNIYDI